MRLLAARAVDSVCRRGGAAALLKNPFEMGIQPRRFMRDDIKLEPWMLPGGVHWPPNGVRLLPEVPKEPSLEDKFGAWRMSKKMAEEVGLTPEQIRHQRKTAKKKTDNKPHNTTKRIVEARGPEYIHTELIHEQFGLIAQSGAFLRWEHLEMMRKMINHHLTFKYRRAFAVWRIEMPWLGRRQMPPGSKISRKSPNTKVHHFVSPVRAGRVIVELGGMITEIEAQHFMPEVAFSMPMKCLFVSPESLAEERAKQELIRQTNLNKFSWDYILKYNMQNCSNWLSPYDITWRDFGHFK